MKYPFVCPECTGPLNAAGCEGTPAGAGDATFAQVSFKFKCVCGADGILTAIWNRPRKKEAADEPVSDVQPTV